MSTQQKKLTVLEKEIVDALANDYENLAQIREMVNLSEMNALMTSALWSLIQEKYVLCYLTTPTKTEMEAVAQPERESLHDYWFALTKKGEQLLTKT